MNTPPNPNPARRFAILEHSWNGVHWDFLLETEPDRPLKTWAIDAPISFDVDLPARSLPDHRPLYLEYEGPISHDRGSVRRLDRGEYEWISWTEDRVEVRIKGTQLEGLIVLRRIRGSSSWLFRLGKFD